MEIWQSHLLPALKPLASLLALHGNAQGGSIFPSVRRLARLRGATERNQQAGLQQLMALAVLVPSVPVVSGRRPRHGPRLEFHFDLVALRRLPASHGAQRRLIAAARVRETECAVPRSGVRNTATHTSHTNAASLNDQEVDQYLDQEHVHVVDVHVTASSNRSGSAQGTDTRPPERRADHPDGALRRRDRVTDRVARVIDQLRKQLGGPNGATCATVIAELESGNTDFRQLTDILLSAAPAIVDMEVCQAAALARVAQFKERMAPEVFKATLAGAIDDDVRRLAKLPHLIELAASDRKH